MSVNTVHFFQALSFVVTPRVFHHNQLYQDYLTDSKGNKTWKHILPWGYSKRCGEGYRLIPVKVEQYWVSYCSFYLKGTPAPCIITMCTVRLQYKQPWIIFWKVLPIQNLPCYQVFTDFQQEENASFHICKSSKVVTLTCSIFLSQLFVKYSLPFLVNVWNLAFAGKTAVSLT